MTKQYGFLIDMQNCYGCKTCSMACKSENMTPLGVLWRRVREHNTDEPNTQAFISMSCNHCDDPQCMKVCPAGTYTKRADGIVVQDHERCIGCRMCIMACPWSAPVYDAEEGKPVNVICVRNAWMKVYNHAVSNLVPRGFYDLAR